MNDVTAAVYCLGISPSALFTCVYAVMAELSRRLYFNNASIVLYIRPSFLACYHYLAASIVMINLLYFYGYFLLGSR